MNFQGNKIKLIIVGDANSGKTTMVKRIKTGDFIKNYIPTIGVEVHPLDSKDYDYEIIKNKTINIWDCAGDERFGGLRDGYYIGANCAIVTFCDQKSANNVINWVNDIKRVCGDIPILICKTKDDIITKTPIDITLDKPREIIECSFKTCFNWEKPINLTLANFEAFKQK